MAIVAALVSALAVAVFLLVFTARGRALGRRMPFYDRLQRILFGGAKVPEADAYGIDVSRYQGDIRWDDVRLIPFNVTTRRQGADDTSAAVSIGFIFAKATEGADYQDPCIEANRRGIRSTGALFGAYHVMTMANAEEQADNFISHSGLRRGDLTPVIDLEEALLGDYGVIAVRKVLASVAKRLKNHYGKRPIIYTSQSYAAKLLDGGGFDGYPLWIARYSVAEPPDGADVWQFSENGQIPGICVPVDLNALYATRFRLSSYIIAQ